jgi:membrane peptidoglycan carboxypeptidase
MRRTDKLAPRLWARRHRRLTILTGLLLILIALLGATYAWLAVDLPSPDELYHRRSTPSTRILDRQGRLLYAIIDPHAGHHQPLSLDEIPLACQQATIATEDANFYANPGVDLAGILRAAWINLRGGEVLAGGSTITQQLTRNLLLDPQERAQRTLKRKLRESLLAWRIARRYDKDEILTLYLNETYYGNLAYGIQAAAKAYFGKPATDLDLAECALLAGLPQRCTTPWSIPRLPKFASPWCWISCASRATLTRNKPGLRRPSNFTLPQRPFPSQRRTLSCTCAPGWRKSMG